MTANGKRVPPHSKDIEVIVLGAMLLAPAAVDAARGVLVAADFYVPGHGHVFDAVLRLHADGDHVDSVTVTDELRRVGLLEAVGGPAELVSLQARAVSTSPGYVAKYARTVAKYAEQRRLLGLAAEITNAVYGGTPVGHHVEEMAKLVSGTAAQTLRVTLASEIEPRPVHWFWADRVPMGALSLVAGREGIGKSTFATGWLVAQVTKGTLRGSDCGKPRSAVICATEDSWAHIIVPRLMAAGADLTRVFRVDITVSTEFEDLVLPRDVEALEKVVTERDVSLIVLDPLLSRLDTKLDTHKDAEVRRALEPLAAMADRTQVTVVGLLHVNKGADSDPLNRIMASRAFTACARAAVYVMTSPENEDVRLLGNPKNNYGRANLPSLTFTIAGKKVADTDDGPVMTSVLDWGTDDPRSIREALADAGETGSNVEGATKRAAEWLETYLAKAGGGAPAKKTKEDGIAAGHSKSAINRARSKLAVDIAYVGKWPTVTVWTLPSRLARVGGDTPGITETTGTGEAQLSQSSQLSVSPREKEQLEEGDHDL